MKNNTHAQEEKDRAAGNKNEYTEYPKRTKTSNRKGKGPLEKYKMKKLLALVLCVMMFVAIIPTAAFADSYQPAPTPATPTDEWPSIYASTKAISNAKKNIEYLYNGLAADNAVFSGIKAMDSFVVDLAKGLFTDVDDFTYYTTVWDGTKYVNKKITVSNDTLVKNTKAELRSIIGDSISDYMNDHIASFAELSTHYEVKGGTAAKPVNYILRNSGFATLADANNSASTVYVGGDGKIYTYDVTRDKFYAADDTYLMQLANAWGLEDGQTAYDATSWGKLTPDQKAAYAVYASSANRNLWTTAADTTVVKDYRYDPIKYANAFSTAMSKALTSEKGAKGLEAYVYGLMQAKAAKEISDKFDDFWDAVEEWEDGTAILSAYGWNEYSLDPYAFIDAFNVPKASMDLSDIAKPDATSFSWHWDGLEWVAD